MVMAMNYSKIPQERVSLLKFLHTQTHTRTHTHTSLRKKDLYMGKFTRTVKNILRLGAKKS